LPAGDNSIVRVTGTLVSPYIWGLRGLEAVTQGQRGIWIGEEGVPSAIKRNRRLAEAGVGVVRAYRG